MTWRPVELSRRWAQGALGRGRQREAWADAGLLLRNRNVRDRTRDTAQGRGSGTELRVCRQSASPARPLSSGENKTNTWKRDVVFPTCGKWELSSLKKDPDEQGSSPYRLRNVRKGGPGLAWGLPQEHRKLGGLGWGWGCRRGSGRGGFRARHSFLF